MVGDEVLENKIRRMIFNHITKYSGVSFNTLKDIYEEDIIHILDP
jgi:hypothetical protein